MTTGPCSPLSASASKASGLGATASALFAPGELRDPALGRVQHTALELARIPAGRRLDRPADDPVLVALDRLQHRADELLAEQVGLQPEVEKLRVGGVVVVLLELDPWVGDVLDLDVVAELGAALLHELGELGDRELLGELVEDAEVAEVGRVLGGELDAAQRVADVEEAAGLASLPVDGQRMADDGLHAEAVEDGAEG